MDGDPWQRYIHASDKLEWAREYQQRLYEEDERQKLLGGSVPNFSIRSSSAYDRMIKSLDGKETAGRELSVWFLDYGVSEQASALVQWFSSIYAESNNVLQSHPPDMVFRVAVHERQMNCP